jgi:hypothetical protein
MKLAAPEDSPVSAWAHLKNPRKQAFLAAYAITGSVKFACAESNVRRESHYQWKRLDADYLAAFQLAEEIAADVLVDEAKRRAHKGTHEYILYQGTVVQYQDKPLMRVKYSDSLLQFLIENLKKGFVPKREIAHSTPEPIKLEVTRTLDLSRLTEEELQTLERISERITGGSAPGTPAPEREED